MLRFLNVEYKERRTLSFVRAGGERVRNWRIRHMIMNKDTPDPAFEQGMQRATRILPWFLLMVGGLIIGGIGGLFWAISQRPAVLTAADFEVAKKKWEERRLANYDIEIVVKGAQPATYTVEVRDGTAIKALRNGNPLTQQRTFATWSVDGMFGTMESDVASLEQQKTQQAKTGELPTLMLRAEFDPMYGFPKRFFRADWQRNLETSWTVTRFEALQK